MRNWEGEAMDDSGRSGIDLLSVCLLVANTKAGWPPVGDLGVIAAQARDEGSVDRLLAGRVTAAGDDPESDESSTAASSTRPKPRSLSPGPLSTLEFTREALRRPSPQTWQHVRGIAAAEIDAANAAGARMTTVLDHDFPSQLKAAGDTPLVFYRGRLDPERDASGIAIEASRALEACQEHDAEIVQRLTARLVEAGITVVARLETGTGLQALEAALNAGGRCIAVLYEGIASPFWTADWCAEMRGVADRVVQGGGLVVSSLAPSQSWGSPGWSRYLIASELISGVGQAMVVIRSQPDDTEESAAKFESFTQAHDTSLESTSVMDIAARNQGAYRPEYLTACRVREQAKIAQRQDRQVLLLDTVTSHLHWPNEMVTAGHATVTRGPADVVGLLA